MSVAPDSPVARFDRLYERSADPWNYRHSPYEQEKYAATLAALPAGRFGRALELGCSIGVFTEQLAPRCRQLLALDFSEPAIALAERRVGGLPNVELRRASFPDEAPAGRWDLIVCSEILYYLQPPELERAISWLRCQLSDGACAVVVSWRGEGRDEPFRGDEVHDRLARELAVWKTLDGRREGYRLDRFGGR